MKTAAALLFVLVATATSGCSPHPVPLFTPGEINIPDGVPLP